MNGLFKPLVTDQEKSNAIDDIELSRAKLRSIIEKTKESEDDYVRTAERLASKVEERQFNRLTDELGRLSDAHLDHKFAVSVEDAEAMALYIRVLADEGVLDRTLANKLVASLDRVSNDDVKTLKREELANIEAVNNSLSEISADLKKVNLELSQKTTRDEFVAGIGKLMIGLTAFRESMKPKSEKVQTHQHDVRTTFRGKGDDESDDGKQKESSRADLARVIGDLDTAIKNIRPPHKSPPPSPPSQPSSTSSTSSTSFDAVRNPIQPVAPVLSSDILSDGRKKLAPIPKLTPEQIADREESSKSDLQKELTAKLRSMRGSGLNMEKVPIQVQNLIHRINTPRYKQIIQDYANLRFDNLSLQPIDPKVFLSYYELNRYAPQTLKGHINKIEYMIDNPKLLTVDKERPRVIKMVVTKKGHFGDLRLNMRQFQRMILLAKNLDGTIVAKGPISPGLYDLLSKTVIRGDKRFKKEDIDAFCRLVELAKFPIALGNCLKYKMVQGRPKVNRTIQQYDEIKNPSDLLPSTPSLVIGDHSLGNGAVAGKIVKKTVPVLDQLVKSGDDLIERLDVLMGSINAGNENPELVEEASKILDELVKNNFISPGVYENLLNNLIQAVKN